MNEFPPHAQKGVKRPVTSGTEFRFQEFDGNKDFKIDVLEGNLSDVLESFDFETTKKILMVYVRRSHIHASENKQIGQKLLNHPTFVKIVHKYFAFTGVVEISREAAALKRFDIPSSEFPCLAFFAYNTEDELKVIDLLSLKGSNLEKLCSAIDFRLESVLEAFMSSQKEEELRARPQRPGLPLIKPEVGRTPKPGLPDKDQPKSIDQIAEIKRRVLETAPKPKPGILEGDRPKVAPLQPPVKREVRPIPKLSNLLKEPANTPQLPRPQPRQRSGVRADEFLIDDYFDGTEEPTDRRPVVNGHRLDRQAPQRSEGEPSRPGPVISREDQMRIAHARKFANQHKGSPGPRLPVHDQAAAGGAAAPGGARKKDRARKRKIEAGVGKAAAAERVFRARADPAGRRGNLCRVPAAQRPAAAARLPEERARPGAVRLCRHFRQQGIPGRGEQVLFGGWLPAPKVERGIDSYGTVFE